MAETHFDFRGMNVHVHFFIRQFQEKENTRENSRRHDVAISLVDRMQQQTIAYQPAVHKNIDSVAVCALYFRPGSKSTHTQRGYSLFRLERRFGDSASHRPFRKRNLRQLAESLASENLIHAFGKFFHWSAVQDFLGWRLQQELAIGMSQRVVRDERSNVAQLGGF